MSDKKKIIDLIEEKRDEILRIAKKYGASNVRIFGSVARGEDGPDSDVDFLVVLEKGRSLLDHAGLQVALGKLLGLEVHITTEGSLSEHALNQVSKEAFAI